MPRETMTAKRERAAGIEERMFDHYGEGACSLDYDDPFRLTCAVVLSAQCTDAAVNKVTPALYKRFPTLEALAEAGADLLAVETLMGIDEAAAALDAAGAVCGLPVLCSFSVEADGTVPFGGTALEALLTAQELGAAAVGVNCSVGPDQLEAVVRTLAEAAAVPVIAKPNAGLPVIDELGRAVYTMGPRDFARHMAVLARAGASLLGGCCGSAPDYIRALAEVL